MSVDPLRDLVVELRADPDYAVKAREQLDAEGVDPDDQHIAEVAHTLVRGEVEARIKAGENLGPHALERLVGLPPYRLDLDA